MLPLAGESTNELDDVRDAGEADDPPRAEQSALRTLTGLAQTEDPHRCPQQEPVHRPAPNHDRLDLFGHGMNAQERIEEGLGGDGSVGPVADEDVGVTHQGTVSAAFGLDQGAVSRRSGCFPPGDRSRRRT